MKKMTAITRMSLAPLLLCLGALSAQAQPWPSKPIKVIVPAAPASSVDNVTRMLTQALQTRLNTQFVVDYKPGALGGIAGAFAARSAPDGYTFLMGAPDTQVLGPLVNKNLTYSAENFVPVALISEASMLIAASPKVPANTLKELVAYARANPGKLTFSSAGVGGIQHLAIEHVKNREKINILHVPYKSSTAAATGLMAGEVDLLAASPTFLAAMINDGRAKGIAIARETRHPLLPNLPTMAEAGLPNVKLASWVAMFAPAGTPPDIVAKMSATIMAICDTPDIQQRLKATGMDMVPMGHEPFAKFMNTEWVKWREVVTAAGVKAE